MNTYKIIFGSLIDEKLCILKNNSLSIPFNIENTDYTKFKKEIVEETARLQDAEGNTMTAAEAKAFVATLP